jgi:phosphoribosylformimino-5-aminoimidazole carboxamide ribonucleotide (ProFAR) isomerase
MKCKVFTENISNLENAVNNWLSTGKFNIVKMTQSYDVYVTLTIIYEDIKEIRRKKLDKIDNI